MKYSLKKESYVIGDRSYDLLVPDQEEVKDLYKKGIIAFPYWSRVWPSAIAISNFIVENTGLVSGKKVLELAAGLGLPSFVASSLANNVVCSDQDEDSVAVMKASIEELKLSNCTAIQLDWQDLPETIHAEIILMSDVNYDPPAFEGLMNCFHQFIHQGKTIILASPQRIMAKEFIGSLLPLAVKRKDYKIKEQTVSVFVLQQKNV